MSRRRNAKGNSTRYSASYASLRRTLTDPQPLHPLVESLLLEYRRPLESIKTSTRLPQVGRETGKMLGSSTTARLAPLTLHLAAFTEITVTESVKTNSLPSRTSRKIRWYQPIQIFRLEATMDKNRTILRTLNSFTRCFASTTNYSDRSLSATGSAIPSHTSGTSCGVPLLAKVTSMKV